ncbi:SGNH hydrolase, partial [Ramicandelaber brevisporus]
DYAILLGDSITQMGFSVEHGGWVAALSDYYQRRLNVLNRGSNGHTTRQARITTPQYLPAAGSPEAAKTKLVTIFYGTNDATTEDCPQHVPETEYRQNMYTIIRLVHERVPDAKIIVITPGPIVETMLEASTRKDANAKRYGACIKQIVADIAAQGIVDGESTLAVFDFNAAVKDDANVKNQLLEKYVTDGVHLSSEGNRVLFEGVKKTIETKWPQLSNESLK